MITAHPPVSLMKVSGSPGRRRPTVNRWLVQAKPAHSPLGAYAFPITCPSSCVVGRWWGQVAGVDSVGALGLLVYGRLSAIEETSLIGVVGLRQAFCERTNPLVGVVGLRQAHCERTNKPSRRGFMGARSVRTNEQTSASGLCSFVRNVRRARHGASSTRLFVRSQGRRGDDASGGGWKAYGSVALAVWAG